MLLRNTLKLYGIRHGYRLADVCCAQDGQSALTRGRAGQMPSATLQNHGHFDHLRFAAIPLDIALYEHSKNTL